MADVEMVERVARAIEPILAVQAQSHCWNSVIFRRKLARAAIEALRDLPESIAERLSWHFNNDICAGDQYQVKSLWNDALDAILKEK